MIALATVIANEMNLALNSCTSLICIGIGEMSRPSASKGGSAETFMGMRGVGYSFLTTTDSLRLNQLIVQKLGQGLSFDK